MLVLHILVLCTSSVCVAMHLCSTSVCMYYNMIQQQTTNRIMCMFDFPFGFHVLVIRHGHFHQLEVTECMCVCAE